MGCESEKAKNSAQAEEGGASTFQMVRQHVKEFVEATPEEHTK